MTPEEFLVKKGILSSTDLNTKWNLNISRDCYIATSKKIVEALKEYAEYYANRIHKSSLE